jgi:leucyl-tRNA synthetase
MFLGPLEQSKPWNTNGITGVYGFLKKLWKLFYQSANSQQPATNSFSVSEEAPSKAELKSLHKTIKKVTDDIDRFSFNTSVSNFMICVNELTELKCNKRAILEPLIILIAPYAPHIAEEIWEKLGHSDGISYQQWPVFEEKYLTETAFNYPVSFNGKTRFFHEFDLALNKEQLEKEVMALNETQKYLEGKSPKKVIVVHNKIVNIVV